MAARGSAAPSLSAAAKNATLPILMASLLTAEPVTIRNVPHLRDVNTAIALLRRLGVESEWTGESQTDHSAPNA